MNYSHLYFFTASFPFDYRETFIETEIQYLSESFSKVTIIPLYGDSTIIRVVPDNCEVLTPIIRNKRQHYIKGLFSFKAFSLYRKDFLKKKAYKNINRFKTILIAYCTTNCLLQSKQLMTIVNEANLEDVLYFYWGVGAAYLLPFLKTVKSKKVIRFHGEWDLYEELSGGGYTPIRDDIIQSVDNAVFISKKGLLYFSKKYPNNKLETTVCYLGTRDSGISAKSNKDEPFRLLSCSGVIPLKRVSLIYKSLQLIEGFEIEWTHIGGGIEFNELKEIVKFSKKSITVKLLGQFTHEEVISYYKKNKVDAFINVSTIEGLPVSLIEAISFNVPVIGTDVGGTSEIVITDTGILLNENPTSHEVASAIEKIRFLELNPKSVWEKRFDAEINYPMFIKNVLN